MFESGIIEKDNFNIGEINREFIERNGGGGSGAILSFIGIVRRSGHIEGKGVIRILIEAHEDLASKVIKNIARELKEKYDLTDALIIHAVGEFSVGEPLVYVGLAKEHRTGLFEAMKEAIDRYKSEPPLFKKEIYIDGSGKWISTGKV
jgi:molybdopterin synthase catalytic subunit